MAEKDVTTSNPPAESAALADPSAAFEKMQELLKTKNDTSRFVGLALLKSVLDNGQLVQDPEKLRVLWEAMSPKFLDRLLQAQENEKISKIEAKEMVDLAVAVIHTFSKLLPQDALKERRLTGRIDPLVKALIRSTSSTTELILQSLLTIVSQPEGALEMLRVQDLSPLIEIATQHSLVLDILSYTWLNASTVNTEIPAVRQSIDNVLTKLVVVFKQTDAVTLMQSVADFLPKLPAETLSPEANWLVPLVSSLRNLVSKKPTAAGRAAYSKLAAVLLQAYPVQCPILLFKDSILKTEDSKPFSYLLINLLLIDLRSSFPSLLSQLNSTEYYSISQRLAATCDILSSFIGFLIRSLDDEASHPSFSMPPDLLLKLRKDISETMSLMIEYLRDRWDASIAGASGLHPEARAGTAASLGGKRLTLTWDSKEADVVADPLVLAGIRVLAIWIREDENDNLRNESSGLMDMLVELYNGSAEGTLDFRYPVLLALDPILLSERGVEGFLEHNGWMVLFNDLESTIQTSPLTISEASRGLEIVRVLLSVIDHPSTYLPNEEWMAVIGLAASMKAAANTPPLVLEFQIGVLQLSTAILSKAAQGVQKRYVTSIPALLGLVNQLEVLVKNISSTEAADLLDLLEDVSLELENLRAVR
ncbi:Uncharacterized protein BP5553_07447 [Venustampulla echinocandica]|uniref:DUF1941-domain-containing protein n=1 Tax=Venustampulla echinocandica TaxID=2656787 RepID=A0A370TGJ5_9HELO|nr:Uncharacterized protein BP5553_07447 [Venustampulla echinocandica]RDL34319.1 Uncharacterized protein BP5553_07447 [Venustampulla echinocandica]